MKTLTKHLLIIFSIFLFENVSAQALFQKRINHQLNDNPAAMSMRVNRDNGCIITGTYYAGNSNGAIYIYRTDSSGNVMWQNSLVGNNLSFNSYDVVQTPDNGFVICGSAEMNAALSIFSLLLVRLDSSGNVKWQKAIGDSQIVHSSSIIETRDGGFLITGDYGFGSYQDIIIKTDTAGNIQWSKIISGTNGYFGFVKETADSGFILAGSLVSPMSQSYYDIYLTRLNKTGMVIWSKFFGGNGAEYVHDMMLTEDSSIVILGQTDSFLSSPYHAYMIKTDINGTLLWSKAFDGNYSSSGNSIRETLDQGYLIIGKASVTSTTYDMMVIKTDANGNIVWSRNFGGLYNDIGFNGEQLPDSTYLICGTSSPSGGSSNIYLLKLDKDGNSPCYNSSPTTVIVNTQDRDSTGTLTTYNAPPFAMTTTYASVNLTNSNSTSVCISTNIERVISYNHINIYPNPSNGEFALTASFSFTEGFVEIYYSSGTKVFEKKISPGRDSQINLTGLSPGIYFVKVAVRENMFWTKCVLN